SAQPTATATTVRKVQRFAGLLQAVPDLVFGVEAETPDRLDGARTRNDHRRAGSGPPAAALSPGTGALVRRRLVPAAGRARADRRDRHRVSGAEARGADQYNSRPGSPAQARSTRAGPLPGRDSRAGPLPDRGTRAGSLPVGRQGRGCGAGHRGPLSNCRAAASSRVLTTRQERQAALHKITAYSARGRIPILAGD